MASAADVLSSIKSRLGITNTNYDTQLSEFRDSAVRRLYPRASLEVESQELTSITVDSYGECAVDIGGLPTSILAARKIEAFDGYTWRRITDTYHHGTKLRLRGLSQGSDTKLRIYGIKAFPDVPSVYDHLLQAVYWYAISEFYDLMARNKSMYNIYMQQSGARAVDNMRDEADYYDQRANEYLEEQNQAYGL